MYYLNNISLHFGGRTLFNNISVVFKPGEKIALLGRNGSGKTTLFKIINGDLTPSEGNVSIPKDARIGLLDQHLDSDPDSSIREACRTVFDEYYSLEDKIGVCLASSHHSGSI